MHKHMELPGRAIFAAFAAILVGIGLARFAYSPLIPAVVAAQWFTPAEAAYLGAANLGGYLVGALAAPAMGARIGTAGALRAMMLLAALTFFASAAPLSFTWFFAWRLASGVAGGALMVLAAPSVLSAVPPSRSGLAGGMIFTAVGLGIAAAGMLVPPLLELGLAETWLSLGGVAVALAIATWSAWPTTQLAQPAPPPPPRPGARLGALCIGYGLNAFGLVPHMVFLVDYIARGLGQGLAAGARYWTAFGLGAMAGPMLAGMLADRIGFTRALRGALAVQALAVIAPAVSPTASTLLASSFVVGAFTPGIVPLVLGRSQELAAGAVERAAAWRTATIAFALGQAIGACVLSYVFDLTEGGFALLFAAGAAAIALALAIDLLATEPWKEKCRP